MEVVNERRMKPLNLLEYIHTLEDDRFDLVYPPEIRAVSSVHWTPVIVARRAAEFLVREPGTRVLDIGCGPGKFCIVGALMTEGRFTGVEQRQHLCDLAQSVIGQAKLPNAEIIHGNVTDIEFSNFEAFYLFNPFEENLETTMKIDATVHLSGDLYEKYTEHVARQLALAPLGTRVVTYCGTCEEVPLGYESLDSSLDYSLKFWEKTKNHPVRASSLEAMSPNNKSQFMADAARASGLADRFFG
ncbi:MAG: class I SAM-dependent methyltransferase [Verrucomicrobia bacterium]|nr:class I SAM-dependent methyltransferase [Verrucomicrobiota bacterium]